jgi:hypothetical protein
LENVFMEKESTPPVDFVDSTIITSIRAAATGRKRY